MQSILLHRKALCIVLKESKSFSMASLHSSPVQGPDEDLQAGLAFSLAREEISGCVLLATSVRGIGDCLLTLSEREV